MKVVKILGGLIVVAAFALIGMLIFLIFLMPNVEPAPDIAAGNDAAAIERGGYLTNHVMVCVACHSERDAGYFAMPVKAESRGAGGERWARENDFPGLMFAPNITPHGIGKWTDGEVLRAIAVGVDRDGEPIFPVMPYDLYRTLDRGDLLAVVAYLRTLPAVKRDYPKADIDPPMNLIIRAIPEEAAFTKRPAASDQVARGEYLVTAASCIHCHTEADNGRPVGAPFAGGNRFLFPDIGLMRSANITPDKETGIGSWSREQFIARFKDLSPDKVARMPVKPGEPNTIMPWSDYAGMSEEDLGAIFAYLKTLPPVVNKVTTFEAPAK